MLKQLKKLLNKLNGPGLIYKRLVRHITTVMIFKELLSHKQYNGYALSSSEPKMVKQAIDMADAIEKALNENPQ